MRSRETVIVLVVRADRGIEPFGQLDEIRDRAREDHAGAGQDDREAGFRQEVGCLCDRLFAAGRTLEADHLRQFDVDHLGPHVARDVHLRRGRAAPGLHDHPVEHFGNARRVANLFLVADAIGKQPHLLHFLEAALTDGLVGRLRRDQEHRGVVPVGGLHRRDKAGDAGTVLGDGHGHLAGGADVTVTHQPGIGLVSTIPEGDAGLREKVRHRHHGRTDDAERMFDAVHLKHFDESFFGGHFRHGTILLVEG
jgi:hypothetical protein